MKAFFRNRRKFESSRQCTAENTQARAVFAHYMVGTVTEAHVRTDIDLAIDAGIDGFALNIGDPTRPFVRTTLISMFSHAAIKEFKLFISIDLLAASHAKKGLADFHHLLSEFLSHEAWYIGPNGCPMVSTFSSEGLTSAACLSWKRSLNTPIYFIPDFDDTQGYYAAHPGWWQYWEHVVDGLFSWESAWPLRDGRGGRYPGDIGPDVTVMKGATAHSKDYMISLSPLQYKNAYGTNLYRAGGCNLPERMRGILRMNPRPQFVQIISWNDGPESHYIGPLWPEANPDPQSLRYANPSISHAPWRDLIRSFAHAFKTGGDETSMIPTPCPDHSNDSHPSSSSPVPQISGCMWYRPTLQRSTPCPAHEEKPQGWEAGEDRLFFAIVVGSKPYPQARYHQSQAHSPPPKLQIRFLTEAGTVFDEHALTKPGLNYGSAGPLAVTTGTPRMEVLAEDGEGRMVAVQVAKAVERVTDEWLPGRGYDMNYRVVGLS